MAHDPAVLLERLSGQTPRPYSTFDFGRMREDRCVSVLVPEDRAQSLDFRVRQILPVGFVVFVGTTRWLGEERHEGQAEVVVGPGESQYDLLRLARSDACNYDMGTEDLLATLQSWDRAYGIQLFHAETDTIEFTLDRLPDDVYAFAAEVYEFCPDVVDQGAR